MVRRCPCRPDADNGIRRSVARQTPRYETETSGRGRAEAFVMTSVEAVVFDLDGVLLDSEQVWDDARRELTIERGGRWRQDATRAMMGMSSLEWSAYMRDELAVPLDPLDISRHVVDRVRALYGKRLPVIPGAISAVQRLAKRWPLGLASSSNRELIDFVLDLARLRDQFGATVSSEEVARGKPAPDVYIEVARKLEVSADRCVAIEDSTNGIQAGKAAGMGVIAVPNRAFPPEPTALSTADRILASLEDLTTDEVERLSNPA
jgi:HAD superfamily hydrolase (TIGR01509 family)